MGVPRTPLRVEVAGIGTFRFRQRTIREQIRIEVEAHRILDGEEMPPVGLRQFALMIASLVVLLDSAPTGFDLDALDPLDPAAFAQIEEVYAALRSAESAFRSGLPGSGEDPGRGAGEPDAHLVSGALQPSSD